MGDAGAGRRRHAGRRARRRARRLRRLPQALRVGRARPAAALVERLAPGAGARFLDLGCGTGAVAVRAAARIAPGGTLVAVDASAGMLAFCRRRLPRALVAVARLPDLPFAAGSFDAIAAGFVLSHLADPEGAVRALGERLAPGARFGASAWMASADESAPGGVWREWCARALGESDRGAAAQAYLPAEERLRAPGELGAILTAAGLRAVRVDLVTLPVALATSDFVASRAVSISGRRVRDSLPAGEWERFLAGVEGDLRVRFGARLEFETRVLLAVGRARGAAGRALPLRSPSSP